jgi:hypothetical protein
MHSSRDEASHARVIGYSDTWQPGRIVGKQLPKKPVALLSAMEMTWHYRWILDIDLHFADALELSLKNQVCESRYVAWWGQRVQR